MTGMNFSPPNAITYFDEKKKKQRTRKHAANRNVLFNSNGFFSYI